VISLDVLLPDMACIANMGSCAVSVRWGPPGARPGAVGIIQSVGPASVAGAIMA
jgi:hypothetical protein